MPAHMLNAVVQRAAWDRHQLVSLASSSLLGALMQAAVQHWAGPGSEAEDQVGWAGPGGRGSGSRVQPGLACVHAHGVHATLGTLHAPLSHACRPRS